jgi:hypothetical protein
MVPSRNCRVAVATNVHPNSVLASTLGMLVWPGVIMDEHHIKADTHIACRAHAVPLPNRTAKGLECVFPI